MLQTSLIYAGLLGLLLVVLSFNVMQNWVRVTGEGRETDRDMRRAERILSSFVEYVPLSLIMLVLIEMKGAPIMIIHLLGSSLLCARLLHAFGSNQIKGAAVMRFIGTQLTFLMIAAASLGCIWYWGLGRM
jgi:uncharacterized membrane protein YecN with MAPEG domain